MFKKKQQKPIEKPQFTKFDYVVFALSIGIILGSFSFGGVFISGSVITALGIVAAVAVLLHKFPLIRRFCVKFHRIVDLLFFIVSFIVASTTFGFMVASFAGIFTTAYLSLNAYFYNLKLYNSQNNRGFNAS